METETRLFKTTLSPYIPCRATEGAPAVCIAEPWVQSAPEDDRSPSGGRCHACSKRRRWRFSAILKISGITIRSMKSPVEIQIPGQNPRTGTHTNITSAMRRQPQNLAAAERREFSVCTCRTKIFMDFCGLIHTHLASEDLDSLHGFSALQNTKICNILGIS